MRQSVAVPVVLACKSLDVILACLDRAFLWSMGVGTTRQTTGHAQLSHPQRHLRYSGIPTRFIIRPEQ